MSGRTFVVIFFFWAVLTIVTPALIHLSESSKPDWETNGQIKSGEPRARRMMIYSEKLQRNRETASASEEAPAPAPSPLTEPVPRNGIEKVVLTRLYDDKMQLQKLKSDFIS